MKMQYYIYPVWHNKTIKNNLREDKTMTVKKLIKKLSKRQALDHGRRQFRPLIRPTAYVFVNNVLVPLVDR